MAELIITWAIPIIAISVAIPYIIAEITFKKQVKELNEEFIREARRIDEIEKRVLGK